MIWCTEAVKEQTGKGCREDITKRKWEKIDELHEILAVVDLTWECSYKRLYDVGDRA